MAVSSRSEHEQTTETSILIACDWKWADRIKAMLEQLHVEIRCLRLQQPQGLPASTTHGGYFWLRVSTDLAQSLEDIRYCEFERHTAGVFPTKHSISDVANLGGKISKHPAWNISTSEKVLLRLHVYDADALNRRQLRDKVQSALVAHARIELSPTDFQLVLVVVRVGGLLEWDLLFPAQYSFIKKQNDKDQATCRAAHKLHDALRIVERGRFVVNKTLPALDVGASPGGWTEALLEHGFSKVVAIDPGKMSDSLIAAQGKHIHHIATSAQEAVGCLEGQRFSIIVCDVNADARMILLEMLLPMLPFVSIGSPLVLTLKLPKRGTESAISWALENAKSILVGYVEELSIHHLFGNTVHERTIIGIRRSAGVEQAKKQAPKIFANSDKEDVWKSSLLAVDKWVVSNHGQLPMRHSRSKQERELAVWMFKQRAHHVKNAAKAGWLEQAGFLEEHSWWSWSSEEEDFLNAMTMLQEWVTANARLPDQIINMVELPDKRDDRRAFLSSWVVAQRRRKASKQMDAKHEAMLNACPHWSWEFDWSQHENSCTFLSGLSANRSAALDRVTGPRFRCSCGQLFFVRDDMTSCYGRHVGCAS